MRPFLALLLLTLSTKAFSQTRICEENSEMYSKCYELDSSGRFKYNYSHCTGSVLGTGSFEWLRNSITFTFDSIMTPQIHGQKIQLKNGNVRISLYHIIAGFPMESVKVDYKHKSYWTDSLGVVEIVYSSGPIFIHQYFERDSITINPDKDNFNKYEVFWQSPGDTFMKQGMIIKMTEKNGKFKFKEKVLGYDDKKDVHFSERRTTFYEIMEK